jgi:hypothetical protein
MKLTTPVPYGSSARQLPNATKGCRKVVIMLLTISFVLCLTVQATAEYKLADGFLLRGEYRRDWSNRPFFLTEKPRVLKKEQNTATVGSVWSLGQKQGTW